MYVDPETMEPSSYRGGLYRLWFGAYGTTILYVWQDSFESAFEEAVEWLDDNAPGHLIELTEDDLKAAAEDEGIEWQSHWPDWEDSDFTRVAESAEADLTLIGHTTLQHGSYVASYEWGGDDVASGTDEWRTVAERSLDEIADDD